MKNLRTTLVGVCLLFTGLCANAQTDNTPLNEPDANRPLLFSSLPETVTVDIERLAGILEAEQGSSIVIPVGTAMRFQGSVISKANKYENTIRSIVIRSTNYQGASLTFSKITDAETGAVSYTARIISMAHGDLYQLQLKNGEYSFIKKNFYRLVNE